MFLGYIDPGTGYTLFTLSGGLIAFLLAFLGLFAIYIKKIFGFIKKHLKIHLLILIIVIVICSIIIAVMNAKGSDFDKKIIILGFDGLSPEIVEKMMGDGELPNFAKLKKEGSYRHILSTNPSQSPVAWTGFATGRNPGKNDVYDFIIRDPKNYKLRLSLSNIEWGKPKRIIKSKCFWNYTSEEKIPAIIIGCPVTFPPDKINGRMISGMGVPDILGTEGTFSFYTTEKLADIKDVGGNVFQVTGSKVMVMNLIGPKVSSLFGQQKNVTVPFKITLNENNDSIVIEYQKEKFELKKGQWSGWKDVSFKVSTFREAKGILKFYLVGTKPEFRLYASPINFDPRDPFFNISYPSGYSRELADKIGLYHTQGEPMNTWAVNEKRLTEEPFLEQVNEVLKEKTATLDLELGRFQKGVLFCYFESPDIIQHMFWRYTDPKHPLYEKDAPMKYKEMIKSWYKKMDVILGNTMKKMGKDDTIIVLSDHGFGTFRRAAHINSWLRANGYLELKDPDAVSGAELLSDISWYDTRAYSIGFGAIYINQQGREKEGIVKPGKETEDLKKEIADGLENWIDDKYGKKIVSKVYKRDDIFKGNFADATPDLYVGFNVGYRASWQTALGAVPEELIEDNTKKWSGDHLFDPVLIPGVIFSNKKIIKENPSLYDLAPTILKVVGFDEAKIKQCDFDGVSLF